MAKLQLNFFFFEFFLNKYFTSKIKKNVFLIFNNFNFTFLENNKYLNWLTSNFKKQISFNYLYLISDLNLLKSIFYVLISKDTFFFSNWLKSLLESLYYKNHKKFLLGLKYVFFFFFKYFKNNLNILGLRFLIKGKIGLGGNSKKKSFFFKLGSFTLNKKKLKLMYNKENVNTLSGSLGFLFFIFF